MAGARRAGGREGGRRARPARGRTRGASRPGDHRAGAPQQQRDDDADGDGDQRREPAAVREWRRERRRRADGAGLGPLLHEVGEGERERDRRPEPGEAPRSALHGPALARVAQARDELRQREQDEDHNAGRRGVQVGMLAGGRAGVARERVAQLMNDHRAEGQQRERPKAEGEHRGAV